MFNEHEHILWTVLSSHGYLNFYDNVGNRCLKRSHVKVESQFKFRSNINCILTLNTQVYSYLYACHLSVMSKYDICNVSTL